MVTLESALQSSGTSEWSLRGEGGANVVLGYTGDDPLLVGKVLRIPKNEYKTEQDAGEKLQLLEEVVWMQDAGMDERDKLKRTIHYARNVLGNRLVHHHLIDAVVVGVPPHVYKRRGFTNTALLVEDSTLIPSSVRRSSCMRRPVISIELKPKCGFIPSQPCGNTKSTIPKYVLKQKLKMLQGKISKLSNYNPLDMFSGDHDRMMMAFQELLKNPQNNLRIFLNGELLKPDEDGYLNELAAQKLDPFFANALNTHEQSWWTALFSRVAMLLLDEGVLENVLTLQKMDHASVDVVQPFYMELLALTAKNLKDLKKMLSAAGFNEVSEHFGSDSRNVDECLKGVSLDALKEALSCILEAGADQQGSSQRPLTTADRDAAKVVRKCVDLLRDYLIASTAKDCSLFITLQSISNGPRDSGSLQELPNIVNRIADNSVVVLGGGSDNPSCHENASQHMKMCSWGHETILYKVIVADLDVKRISKIAEHFQMNQCLHNLAQGNVSMALDFMDSSIRKL